MVALSTDGVHRRLGRGAGTPRVLSPGSPLDRARARRLTGTSRRLQRAPAGRHPRAGRAAHDQELGARRVWLAATSQAAVSQAGSQELETRAERNLELRFRLAKRPGPGAGHPAPGAGDGRHSAAARCGDGPRGSSTLWDAGGDEVPAEAQVLDRWSDESIRWLLLDAQPYGRPGPPRPVRHSSPAQAGSATGQGPAGSAGRSAQVHVDTGRMRCGPRAEAGLSPSARWSLPMAGQAVDLVTRSQFAALDEAGRAARSGPLRAGDHRSMPARCAAVVAVEGQPPDTRQARLALEVCLRIHFFAGSPTVRWPGAHAQPAEGRTPGRLLGPGSAGSVPVRGLLTVRSRWPARAAYPRPVPRNRCALRTGPPGRSASTRTRAAARTGRAPTTSIASTSSRIRSGAIA